MARRYSFTTTEENLFLNHLLNVEKISILQCCPGVLPSPRMEFQYFHKYGFVAVDSFSYTYLSLRKEFEGDNWSNVNIYRSIPLEGEQYDIIHLDLYSSGKIIHSDIAIEDAANRLPLCPSGALIAHIKTLDPESPQAATRVFNTGLLEMSVRMPDGKDELYAVIRNSGLQKAPIRFIDGYYLRSYLLEEELYSRITNIYTEIINAIRQNNSRFFTEVSRNSFVSGNLNPSFYLLRNALYKDGQVPLRTYTTLLYCKDAMVLGHRMSVDVITEDPRLLPLSPTEKFKKIGKERVLTQTAILLKKAPSGSFICSYIHVDKNLFVQIPEDCIVISVDPKKADIRYIVNYLRTISVPKGIGHDVFTSDEDILELPIPYLTLEEQQKFINDYLKSLKNEFNSKINVKDNTLQILVYTPNKDRFEAINKEKLDKYGFRVLKYVEDKSSLKEALSEHYGEKVLSSELADAVLVCADMPATEIQKAIFFVGKVGIRTFYYSYNPSFDSKEIDEDYLEDFNEGYVSGEDWLETIRKRLDAESYKVVDKYPRFFDAAQHLDEEYGWNLVEYATPILSSEPFDMNITKFRETLNNTILAFFQDHHIAPAELEGTAIAAFISDRRFTVSKKGITINLLEEDPGDNTFQKEAWYKHMLVAIRDFGNNDSHTEKEFDSSVKQAAFTIFMEIVIWLNSIRGRYRDRKCLFSIKKDGALLPIHPVESFEIDGRTYLVAGGVHLLDSKRELRNGSQVVILETEDDRFPKNINGQLVSKLAKRSGYFIAIKD